LGTTTSVENSGLLDAILPDFESDYQVRVDVIAVGTGQALALGERGDVDVLIVHAPELEEAFVAAGHGSARYGMAFNDFVIAGPADDPAQIADAASAAGALRRIAEAEALFVSRGDQSGTHVKEMALWEAAGISPDETQAWYLSSGQGMGATLTLADELGAYVLTDRSTVLAFKSELAIATIFGGASTAENPDSAMLNYYSVIPVSSAQNPNVNEPLAQAFAEWLTSVSTQTQIAQFGIEEYGLPLFFPRSAAWAALQSN
jgi:tungstate transport system substrate-binding protein